MWFAPAGAMNAGRKPMHAMHAPHALLLGNY